MAVAGPSYLTFQPHWAAWSKATIVGTLHCGEHGKRDEDGDEISLVNICGARDLLRL